MGNATLLIVARFMTIVGSPLVGLLVVRYLGPDTYGQYASAVAITGLFGFLSDFGIQQSILKFGAGREQLGALLRRGGLLSFIYTGVAISIIAIWVHVLNYDGMVKTLVAIQCIGFIRTPLLSIITAGLQLRGRYERIALWNITTTAVQWIGTILAMALGLDAVSLTAFPIGISLLVVIVMIASEARALELFTKGGKAPARHQFTVESWKFGTAGTMHQIYARADATILSAAREPIEVGYYSVGLRMADLINVFPGIVFNQVLFPKYFLWSKNDRARLRKYYRFMSKAMVMLGINLTLALTFFGNELARIVFNMEASILVVVIPVLAASIVLHFWAASSGAILTTDNHVMDKIRVQAIVAVVSLTMNIILIPKYGIIAAAVAFAGSKLLLALLYTFEVQRKIGFLVFEDRNHSMWFVAFTVLAGVFGLLGLNASLVNKIGLLFAIGVASAVSTWFVWLTEDERSELLRLAASTRIGRKYVGHLI